MTLKELHDNFKSRFPSLDNSTVIEYDHVIVKVPLAELESLLTTLKHDPEFEFKMLMDLTVVDWMKKEPRFELVYHLYTVKYNLRIRLKIAVEDGQSVPTATGIWPVADWLEREMWDLYGIKFNGHKNLKRILLYEGFKGHPLRKDYPYKKQQPRLPETFPSKESQFQFKDLEINR